MTHTAATVMVDNEAFYDICHRNVDFRDCERRSDRVFFGVNEFADLTQDEFAATCTETRDSYVGDVALNKRGVS